MDIVIKISDKLYKFVKNVIFVENESTLFKQTSAERQKTLFLFDILDAIKNGTPIPEQQPCDDCISRQDAIGIVARIKEMHIDDRERYPINYGTICDIDLALQQLPTVTPQQTRWIPVSERLPEEEGWYLVTDASGGLRMTEHSFYMPQEDKMEEPYWDYMNVVAWMPLPEPYKEESEDKNDKI